MEPLKVNEPFVLDEALTSQSYPFIAENSPAMTNSDAAMTSAQSNGGCVMKIHHSRTDVSIFVRNGIDAHTKDAAVEVVDLLGETSEPIDFRTVLFNVQSGVVLSSA